MAPSHLKRAVRAFDDELSVFSQTLQQEIHELRRNVENRPVTGATFYRHCLEDLNERLAGMGEELGALEAVSLDAISLEELVGHAMALYKSNHQQIERLELQLQKYGYADLFAPLPPEDPLDMLELRAARTGGKGGGGNMAHVPWAPADDEGREDDEEEGAAAAADRGGQEAAAAIAGAWASDSEDGEGCGVMGELTNRLAGAALGTAAAAAPGTATRPRPAALAAGLAPMTAAKALMREDTPSSVSSPDALSPSMRELLGKYATSASGAAAAPPSAARRRSTLGGGSGGSTAASPAPAYLSPAFQLAAMEQEMQMQAMEAQAAQAPLQQQQAGTPGATPPLRGADALAAALGGGGAAAMHHAVAATAPEPDGMVLTAMKQTVQKLQDKPGFLEQYRQKFPHIVASTERLLDTVHKGRRPEEEAAAAAAPAAPAGEHQLRWQPANAARLEAPAGSAAGGRRVEVADDDNTLELRAQLLGGLTRGGCGGLAAAGDVTDDLSRAAAAATSYHAVQPAPHPGTTTRMAAASAAPTPASLAPPPSTLRAAASTPAQLPTSVPQLRPVEEAEYGVLPSFIRGQLPLADLNGRLAALHTLLQGRVAAGGHAGFVMADVEALGLGPKGKTFVNSLVKLGRAQLRVAFGGGAGSTTYLLI